ncbi:MAG: hypothetical protein Q8Q15_04495 [bacterium]|nr:hypothetical protein [bacterium]
MSADISHLRQKISLLRTQRADLEDKALRSQAMVRGSLLELMRKCGKPGCKCQRGELHGPNFYLSLPKPGKRSRMLPVPPDKVKTVKSLNLHYHDFQHALTEIRRLNEETESLLLAIREEQLRLGEGKAELPGLPPA